MRSLTFSEYEAIEEAISRFLCDSRITEGQQLALKSWIRLMEHLHSPRVDLELVER